MVDLRRSLVFVPSSIRKGHYHPYQIRLSERALRVLSALRKARLPNNLVAGPAFQSGFPNRNSFCRWIKNAAAAANVPPTIVGVVAPHSLRKTFANEVFRRSGKNILAVQLALGHGRVHNTLYYLPFWNANIPPVD